MSKQTQTAPAVEKQRCTQCKAIAEILFERYNTVSQPPKVLIKEGEKLCQKCAIQRGVNISINNNELRITTK